MKTRFTLFLIIMLAAIGMAQAQPVSYLWSNGATTPEIVVNPSQTTTYYVTITQNGQQYYDSLVVQVDSAAGLFAQDTVRGCGPLLSLFAPEGQWQTLAWSSGESSNSIQVGASGWYYLDATDTSGCTIRDSVFVSLFQVDLGEDKVICAGQSVTLSASTMGGSSAGSLNLPPNLQQGLVGYWPFNGNANDESGNGNNGTVNGATLTTDRFGNAGKAYSFDGVNDNIDVGDNINIPNYSVAAWVQVNELPSLQGNPASIVSKISTWFENFELQYWMDSTIRVQHGNNTTWVGLSTSQPNIIGNWINIISTFDGSQIKIYANGILRSSIAETSFKDVQGFKTYFGARPNNQGVGIPNIFNSNAKLDDIAIYNRALSAAEVQQLYNANTYAWSTGETTPSINVTPTQTTKYYCTVSNGNQSCTDSVTVTVNQPSTGSISASINEGESYSFNGQLLTMAGTYKDTLVNAAGCDSLLTLTLTVNTTPLNCGIQASQSTLCAGQSAALTASANGGSGSATGGASGSTSLPANLQQGLVGYWPFNGNAEDASGNGNNGTVNGAKLTTDRFGNAGKAYAFDGVNNLITVTDNPSLRPISAVSVSCWVNINDGSSYSHLISKRNSLINPPVWNSYGIGESGNNISFEKYYSFVSTPDSQYVSPDAIVPLNKWNHLISVYDGTNLKFYINGILVGSTEFAGIIVYSDLPLYFGGVGLSGSYFNGKLDDIAIYNRALSAAEVQQLYSANTYTWSTGETTPSINVTPSQTTKYYCTVTNGNQSCTDSVTVRVNQPTSGSITASINEGESYSFNGQLLTLAGTYKDTLVNSAGCDSLLTLTLTVNSTPLNCGIQASQSTLCAGQSATLTASANGGSGSTTGGASGSTSLPANLQQGLVGYWPFNGNANDASGNENNGIVNGASLTADRFGQAAKAYSFDGNDNISALPVNTSNGITVSFWTNNINQTLGGQCITQSVYGSDPAPVDWVFEYLGNTPNHSSKAGSYKGLFNSSCETNIDNELWFNSLNVNGWNHVSFSVNPSGEVKQYINGELVGSGIRQPFPNCAVKPNSTLRFGGPWLPSDQLYFNGTLDDIAIYNRALSAAEVQQLYNANTYAWSTGETTPNINVTPTQTTTYYCTVSNGNQSCTDSVTVTVNQPSTASISASINEGESYSFNGQLLTLAGTYTDTLVNAAGCDSLLTLTLTVNSTPLNCGIQASQSTLCAGQSATLTASASGGAGSATGLPANLQQGLVGYWPFNGNGNDASGNGNNGILNGVNQSSDRFGNENSAFSFSGNQTINISHNPNLNLGSNYAISLWYLPTNVPNPAVDLLIKGSNDFTGRPYYLRHHGLSNANQGLAFRHASGLFPSAPSIEVNSELPSQNVWHHLMISIKDSITTLYVDGSPKDTVLFTGFQGIINNEPLRIGGGYYQFNGKIDDVGFWNRALSAVEVQQLYSANTFAWSTGETTPSINVIPTQTTTYYCTVTNGNQSCTDSVTVTVNQPSTASISASINEGESYSFNGQLLTLAGTYTDTLVNAAGCDSLLTLTLTVIPTPLNCGIQASQSTVCAGQSATLSISTGSAGISTENYVDDIDGNRYPTIKIGGRRWMAQNLRTTKFSNGDPIPYIGGNSDWANCVNTQVGAWCYVNNNPDTDSSLGKFYNWYSATDSRNVCPTGWHLSTESDWNKLGMSLDLNSDTISNTNGTRMSTIAGGKLKSTEANTWGPPNVGATNEIGFNSKGTNFRGAGGINYYWPLIRAANYWVPNDFSETKAWVRTINYDEASIFLGLIGGVPVDNKSMGNSIRCVSNTINSLTTYLWSTGETTPSINVTPTQTTKYYCTVSNGNQTCTDSVTVTVNQPTAGSITASINEGESYSFNGQLLTLAGTYTDTLVNAAGCDSLLTLTLTVNSTPLNCGIEASQSTLCAGQSATLTMGNGSAGISTENYVDDIDGNRYPTIQVGGRTWMAKNLRTTRFANGDPITYIEGNSDWANCVNTQVGAWCYVNNNPDTDSSLGKFYNWYAATDSRNVCPTGWHLSTESDWNKLVMSLDPTSDTISNTNGTLMSNIVGGKLKSTESGTWGPPNVGATDEIGFSSKGTNFRGAGGINYYWPLIRAANYWVPNDFSETKAWVRTINYDEASIGLGLIGGVPVDNKSMGNSIRCVSNTINSLTTYLWSTGETTPSINVTPSQTTKYYCTVTNGNQICTDSVTINVNPAANSATSQTSCGSFAWNGQTYSASGTYTFGNGCGTDTLYLTITPVSNSGTSQTSCGSFAWNGQTYSASGTYTFDNGCGTDTLYLTITPPSNSATSQTSCGSFAWNGQTYSASGTYTFDNGCGTDTLYLTITPVSNSGTSQTSCGSFAWNGQTYSTSGTYTFDNGCGTDTLYLSITQPSNSATSQTSCGSYLWNGQTLNNSGTYTFDNGCGTDTLYLTITPVSNSGTSQTACGSFAWNGQTYSASGTYTFDNGCGTDTLYLTITPVSNSGTTQSACGSFAWNGQTYSASGTYTFDNGCGTDTLYLTITPVSNSGTSQTACGSYSWNGQTYIASGTYTFDNGCGTDTLYLTITPVSNSGTTQSACGSFAWNGQTYSASGTYTFDNGCGTDTLYLTITPVSNSGTTQSACGSFAWNGQNYSASGTYTFDNGCGTDTLYLTITPAANSATSQTSCGSFAWNGQTYSASGTYTFDNGCGTDTLYLTITPASNSGTSQTSCGSFVWNGQTYNASGTYTFDNGCGTDTLYLTITPVSNSGTSQTSCGSFAWNGQTYNTSGTYTFDNGCGTDTLYLTITPVSNSGTSQTACGSFAWNGQTYSASGTYTFDNGCGTDTLYLTITPASNSGTSQTSCGSFAWNGQSYSASGTYTFDNGCGTDTLYLSITQPSNSATTQTSCGSFAWNGQTYSASGTYTFDNGCGTDTLYLTITPVSNSGTSQTSCGSFAWNGQTYSTSGTYTFDNGCGTDTLYLTITPVSNSGTSQTSCGSYAWNGQTYSASGTYTFDNGCGTDTLYLSITQPSNSATTQTACGSFAWNGQTYSASGTYTFDNGCGTDTLYLTITPVSNSGTTQSACGSFAWNGQTYSASGTYTFDNGCGTDTLYLTITPYSNDTSTVSACGSYSWNGEVYTSTGVYSDTAGCAISVLDLTITPFSTINSDTSVCGPYTFNGILYSNSGVYTDTIGCQIHVLQLTIGQPSADTLALTACDSLEWQGQWYFESDTVTWTGVNAVGCDSIVTAYLNIGKTIFQNDTATACASYTWHGFTYNSSGDYIFVGSSPEGCDSILSLNLTIIPIPLKPIISAQGPTSFCKGDSLIIRSNIPGVWSTGETADSISVNESGDYYVLNQNACGLAYSDTISVKVSSADFTFEQNPLGIDYVSFTSNFSQIDSLRWNFGDGNTSTATNPVHVYATFGTFNACLTAYTSACDSIKICRVLTITGEAIRQSGLVKLNAMPNPSRGLYELSVENLRGTARLEVLDALGKLVYEGEVISEGMFTRQLLDIRHVAMGVYTLRLQTSQGPKHLRLKKD